jgi:hypothetical protein
MNRRSFAQFLGGPVLLSSLARNSGGAPSPITQTPGKIMAITAHPGDGLFTMGAALANQVERGGSAVLLSLSLGEKGAPSNIPVQEYGEPSENSHAKGHEVDWRRGCVHPLSRCGNTIQRRKLNASV